MVKTAFLAWILVLGIWAMPAHSAFYRTTPYKPVAEKKTNLRVYVHDTLSGDKPSAVPIARPNTTSFDNDGVTPFGRLYAIDDVLTDGPDLNTSKVVGNMQGMWLSSSQDKNRPALVLYVDLGFTAGEFNGSSLSVFSRNPITENPREMAVVGGRGKFRFARGFITVTTHNLNLQNGDAILQYDVEVVHPAGGSL